MSFDIYIEEGKKALETLRKYREVAGRLKKRQEKSPAAPRSTSSARR